MPLQVESFEMFHVGTKISTQVNLDVLASKLKEILTKEGYTVSKDAGLTRPQLLPPVEVLGIRNDVRVEMNYIGFAVNAIGTSPTQVAKVFNDLPHFLTVLGYELDAAVQFYEVLAAIIVTSDRKPEDVLTGMVNWSIKGFDDLGDLKITALRTSATNSERNQFNIIVQPNPASPSSRFVLQLQYRTEKKEEIASFQETINDRLTKFLSSIGGKLAKTHV
jgi:hypothetical protein